MSTIITEHSLQESYPAAKKVNICANVSFFVKPFSPSASNLRFSLSMHPRIFLSVEAFLDPDSIREMAVCSMTIFAFSLLRIQEKGRWRVSGYIARRIVESNVSGELSKMLKYAWATGFDSSFNAPNSYPKPKVSLETGWQKAPANPIISNVVRVSELNTSNPFFGSAVCPCSANNLANSHPFAQNTGIGSLIC